MHVGLRGRVKRAGDRERDHQPPGLAVGEERTDRRQHQGEHDVELCKGQRRKGEVQRPERPERGPRATMPRGGGEGEKGEPDIGQRAEIADRAWHHATGQPPLPRVDQKILERAARDHESEPEAQGVHRSLRARAAARPVARRGDHVQPQARQDQRDPESGQGARLEQPLGRERQRMRGERGARGGGSVDLHQRAEAREDRRLRRKPERGGPDRLRHGAGDLADETGEDEDEEDRQRAVDRARRARRKRQGGEPDPEARERPERE